MTTTEQAGSPAIVQLVRAARFSRVIYVDDFNDPTPDQLQTLLDSHGWGRVTEIARKLDIDTAAGENAVRSAMREITFGENQNRFQRLFHEAARAEEGEEAEKRDAATLSSFLTAFRGIGGDPGIPSVTLTMTKWRSQMGTLLANSENTPTIFVFDDDFRVEQLGSEAGREAMKGLANSLAGQRHAFVLFTHKVVPGDGEQLLQQQLEDADPSMIGRVIVISKGRLDFVFGFAQRLKYALLTADWNELRSKLQVVLAQAQTHGLQILEKLKVEEFERILVHSSVEEGTWLPETVLRIVQTSHEKTGQRLARSSEDVHRLVSSISPVAALEPFIKLSQSGDTAFKLQQAEIIDEADQINGCHLPVRPGDVFLVGTTKYVVVAQACDLAVRADGKRPRDEQRVAALVAIRGGKQSEREDVVTQYPMRYLGETPENASALFADATYCPSWLLDLVVFSADGVPRLSAASTAPKLLTEPWKLRQAVLRERVTQSVVKPMSALGGVEKGVRARVLKSLVGLHPGCKIKPTLSGDAANWTLELSNVKRIQRVRDRHAIALLTAYAAFGARMAFPHSLHRTDESEGDAASPGAEENQMIKVIEELKHA